MKNQCLNSDLREEIQARKHTLDGTLLVVATENLSSIGLSTMHHHERWDGQGIRVS